MSYKWQDRPRLKKILNLRYNIEKQNYEQVFTVLFSEERIAVRSRLMEKI